MNGVKKDKKCCCAKFLNTIKIDYKIALVRICFLSQVSHARFEECYGKEFGPEAFGLAAVPWPVNSFGELSQRIGWGGGAADMESRVEG